MRRADARRLLLFERGREVVAELARQWPTLSYLPSFRAQLAYLEAVERGSEPDRTRLKDINIGVITAKDIEDRDGPAAAVLQEISAAARAMEAEPS